MLKCALKNTWRKGVPDDKKYYFSVLMNKNGALLLQKVELLINLIHDREHDRRTRKLLLTTLSSLLSAPNELIGSQPR